MPNKLNAYTKLLKCIRYLIGLQMQRPMNKFSVGKVLELTWGSGCGVEIQNSVPGMTEWQIWEINKFSFRMHKS